MEFNWESTWTTHEWSCPFRPKEGWGPRIKWTPNMAAAKLLGKTVIFFFFLSLLEEVELLEMKRVLSSKGSKPISYNTNWSQHQSKVPSRGFFPHRQNIKTRLEYCPKWSTNSKHTIRKSQIASKKFIFRKIQSCEIEFFS